MTYKYKYSRKYFLYDTCSGKVAPLNRLEAAVFDSITAGAEDTSDIRLSPACPTSLRYEFAGYDSEAVSEAYGELYFLYANGDIFSAPRDGSDANDIYLPVLESYDTDGQLSSLIEALFEKYPLPFYRLHISDAEKSRVGIEAAVSAVFSRYGMGSRYETV